MKREITLIAALLTILMWAAATASAHPRTFVSAAGVDNNTCGPTSPCRTFAAAVLHTDQNGILTALDSGVYGGFTVTNAMTVQAAPGAYAALGDGHGNAQVIINAGASDVIVLRNLQLNLIYAPTGIEFNSGGALHVENSVIAGFKTGIYFGPSGICNGGSSGDSCSKLFVKDSFIRRNTVGLALTSAAASIDNCRIENNETGLQVGGVSKVTISRSVVASNSKHGITTDYVSVTSVEGCTVSNNGTGLRIYSTSAGPGWMYVSNTLITGNKIGLRNTQDNQLDSVGTFISYGNNRLYNNETDGEFTYTFKEQ